MSEEVCNEIIMDTLLNKVPNGLPTLLQNMLHMCLVNTSRPGSQFETDADFTWITLEPVGSQASAEKSHDEISIILSRNHITLFEICNPLQVRRMEEMKSAVHDATETRITLQGT